MKTSSYKEAAALEGRIVISRGSPRGYRAGYRTFKALAPGPWFRTAAADEYVRLYRAEVLDKLDPQATYDRLVALASPEEPILLCFEETPLTSLQGRNWCHRRMVAEWLEAALNISIPELNQPSTPRLLVPRIARGVAVAQGELF